MSEDILSVQLSGELRARLVRVSLAAGLLPPAVKHPSDVGEAEVRELVADAVNGWLTEQEIAVEMQAAGKRGVCGVLREALGAARGGTAALQRCVVELTPEQRAELEAERQAVTPDPHAMRYAAFPSHDELEAGARPVVRVVPAT